MENPSIELSILRIFFKDIAFVQPLDNSISNSKLIKDTEKHLKAVLKGAASRCTCARRTYGGPCEDCQVSSVELYNLRKLFRLMKTAKKQNLSPEDLGEILEGTKDRIAADNSKKGQ